MEELALSYVINCLNQQILHTVAQKINVVKSNSELTEVQRFRSLLLLTQARILIKKSSILISQLGNQSQILKYTAESYRLFRTAKYSGQIETLTEEAFRTKLDLAWELNYQKVKDQNTLVKNPAFWEAFHKLNDSKYPDYSE
jgi:hypothetical protein